LVQYAPVNAKVLDARPEIRIAAAMARGSTRSTPRRPRARGVWVANSPDYGVGEVATHALAMALSLVRHLPAFDRDVRAGQWHYSSTGLVKRGSQLTLGILGLGRIGSRMAQISRACFGHVLACDPYLADAAFPDFVRRVDPETLFREADVLSLHVPLNDETRHIVNERALALMKRGAILVNTARGGVVDLDALAGRLDATASKARASTCSPRNPCPPTIRSCAIPASSCRRTPRSIRRRAPSSCAARPRRT
jgi:D-3-phosphoglycerate dehydrogenase